ncbi:MAG: hypothetical protein ABI690_26200 [Chloroflexota bacterium]
MEFIEYCKQTRKWARVVRDGVRLIWSLGEGDPSVLYELFPWTRPQTALLSPMPDTENLERQIADLKQIMLQQGTGKTPQASYPMLKSSSVPPVVTLKNAPAADAGSIADNFLAFIQ